MLTSLLDLVAPPRCAACRVRAPLPWCGRCHATARSLQLAGACPRCAGTCATRHVCPLDGAPVASTVAAFRYQDVVAQTIVAGKAAGLHAVWRPLGAHLGVRVRGHDVDAVVPVPTERGRARRRGFDHTLLLARAVADVLGRPVARPLRTRRHAPDRGRGDHARELPRGTIVARGPAPPRVLLVDDVLTTGATVRAAAAAAVVAGAERVVVGLVARADRGSPVTAVPRLLPSTPRR